MIVQTPATLSSALQHYINSTAPSHGRKIHAHILKTGFRPNTNVSMMEVEPNHVTFLAVISACGHGGLVAKGREIFDSMERDYSLKPKMEHYACMVDLLGRAGCLQEAWEVVMAMEERPNSDVWAALLNSCNFHGNVEMANVAANELFKLNAKGRPGAYVSFSNTLAAVGKWDDVGRVRDVMKVRGVLKDTASSWVGTESSP
ncbi:Pentatricopeptide repeat-containing protein At1g28690, mitochondrial [Linum grandiflorum]